MADLITDAELLAAWPGLSSLASAEQAAVIASASAAVEGFVGRTLGLATHDEIHRPGPTRSIYLYNSPVNSILTIEHGRSGSRVAIDADAYTLTASSGLVELYGAYATGFRHPDRPHGGDPRYGDVRVEYTAGWAVADVPADIKRATIIAAKAMNQGVTAGMYASQQLGEYSFRIAASESSSNPSGIPPLSATLLRRYRRVRFS